MKSTQQIRAELLTALAELSRIRPDWRLGQTLTNLAMTAGRLDAGGVWDLEDEEALAAARALIEQNAEIEGRRIGRKAVRRFHGAFGMTPERSRVS